MATTDLHMHLLGYNYIADAPVAVGGLARLAPLIKVARAEALSKGAACVLLDNGDTLQGTAVGDHLAARGEKMAHPMVLGLNALGYDAVGLGNHDFDHGLAYLGRALDSFAMPVLCSNLRAPSLRRIQPFVILKRALTGPNGETNAIHIGVLSVIPPQTAEWNQNHLSGAAQVDDAIETLSKMVPMLRKQGADLVVVLAHMGISRSGKRRESQNAALLAARIKGVDAVIAGHTHVRFPSAAHEAIVGADTNKGTLHGKPAALPGFGGSDLAVIDLALDRNTRGTWSVMAHHTALRPVPCDAPEDADIARLAMPAHLSTRRHLSEPAGSLKEAMNSYFALVQPCPMVALVAAAKRQAIARIVKGTDQEHLPLLSAASCQATSGLSGPENFMSVPKGQITRRTIAGMCPFANQIWAVRITGRNIIEWLERSARLFHHLHESAPDQPLIDHDMPGFRFDALYGLTYSFDPTKPPRFDLSGSLVNQKTRRVQDVRWEGRPIEPTQEFLVATTHFRAGAGLGFDMKTQHSIAVRSEVMLDAALIDYLKHPDCEAARKARPWRFAPDLGVSAIFQTAPEALAHLSEISQLNPEDIGRTEAGFAQIRVHL